MPSSESDDERLIKKSSFKSRWGRLKRRLSLEIDHIDSPSFDDNEILPDELEYIEGGDIVHSEAPQSPAYDHSRHSLGPLIEEKESERPKSAENKSNNSEMTDRSKLSHSTNHGSPNKTTKSLTPVSFETRM